MLQDLRLAVRTLRKHSAYTLVAVLALGLGIGSNVAIFSAVNTVLLAPLPYPDPDRLVAPVTTNAARNYTATNVSFADFEDYRAQRDIFADVALFTESGADVTGGAALAPSGATARVEGPERADVARVSERFFDVFAAAPLVGRTFDAADFTGPTDAVVISEGLWQRRFGRDPGVTSRELRIGGRSIPIIGVMAGVAAYPADVDVWLPLNPATIGQDERTRRDNFIFGCVARLKAGVSVEQASARLASIAARVALEFPESRAQWSARGSTPNWRWHGWA